MKIDYTNPNKEMINFVDYKLKSEGYEYVRLLKAVENPDYSKYLEFEKNTVLRIYFTVFISSVAHINEPNFVRVGVECYYLVKDGKNL